MACLDTDFLIALIGGRPEAVKRAQEMDAEGMRKTTTPVNAFEVHLGAHLSKQKEKNLELVRDLLYSLEVLDFDEKSCDMAGGIAATLKKLDNPIGARDSMIAGMVQRFDQTLITRNTEHFSRVKGLKISTW